MISSSLSLADFLSPKIARLHLADPSIMEYYVEIPDSQEQFGSFLSLGQGSSLNVDERNQRFLLSISRELDNHELYYSILNHFQENSSVSEFFAGFSGYFPDFSSPDSIVFLSSHFYHLARSTLDAIPFSTLFSILSESCLRISSEDDLYDFIHSRV
jgi:hypothetical protein